MRRIKTGFCSLNTRNIIKPDHEVTIKFGALQISAYVTFRVAIGRNLFYNNLEPVKQCLNRNRFKS